MRPTVAKIVIIVLVVGVFTEGAMARKSKRKEQWGNWADPDRDCQDTRAEILISSSKSQVKFKRKSEWINKANADQGGKGNCIVTHGEWYDPYTGKVFKDAAQMDIDHIVPVGHAWNAGAKNWDKAKRKKYFNDYENLVAVGLHENRSKNDKSPLEYLPPRGDFHCEYLTRWHYIKKKWELSTTADEDQFILEAKQASCKKNQD